MKRTVIDNWRIEVKRDLHGYGEQHFASLCAETAKAIRRHVVDVDQVTVRHDTHDECSFCGEPWEVETTESIAILPDLVQPGDGPGLPVCCTAAQDEWRAAQTGVTA